MHSTNAGRDCKHFNGYKPCFPGEDCTETCVHPNPMGVRMLIVNLDAMGDVLMTTAQLAGLKRLYPVSTISWITMPNAFSLIANNPLVDRAYAWSDVGRMMLLAQHFDIVLSADKSVEACAFVASLDADEIRGFTLSKRGQIIPANPEAEYNYRLGLDDHLKFRINQRTGQDILAETWKNQYERDDYMLVLTDEETAFCARKRREYDLEGKRTVGFNTGCSELFPNKKMTVEQHVHLIDALSPREDLAFLLLGGAIDGERNHEIAQRVSHLGGRVIETPTAEGLRRGICYENLADIVITGDSFGMHLAIALKKYVIAWFGLSCWTEIDLYDRGAKFFRNDLACSPCWKKACPYDLECISGINLDGIVAATHSFADILSPSK
jgi:ADP-heptose:LPS heptosyltransferase